MSIRSKIFRKMCEESDAKRSRGGRRERKLGF